MLVLKETFSSSIAKNKTLTGREKFAILEKMKGRAVSVDEVCGSLCINFCELCFDVCFLGICCLGPARSLVGSKVVRV